MTINATAPILLALYIAVAEKQNVDLKKLAGTVQNDLLKEYAARGNYIYPPAASMRLTVDLIEYANQHLPKWNPISISGYHMREAGCTAVQEVAFTLANGLAYVRAAVDRGLDVNAFGPRLSFFFNAHNHFFEEIAKYRAARRLWATLLCERFKANDDACRLRFHTQTGGSTLTAQQIENNVVRVAYQAMAAVLGGTQSLHTNAKDEALALPTEESARTALRTQQILAHETGVTDAVDPLAGSVYVEQLTDDIEQGARDYIQRIDQMGGSLRAIETGFIQGEIQNAAYAYQQAIESKQQIIVGVNEFTTEEHVSPAILRIDPQLERKQKERLAKLRTERNKKAVATAQTALIKAARGDGNLLPPILECVRCYTTLGEISDTLREVFGTYKPIM